MQAVKAQQSICCLHFKQKIYYFQACRGTLDKLPEKMEDFTFNCFVKLSIDKDRVSQSF